MTGAALDRIFSFRFDLASRAAALSFASNLGLMVMKFAVAFLTGSVAVLSDAIDSAEDVVASTFAFASIRLASQPADAQHPYGHGKAEGLAAVGQAMLLAGGGGFIIFVAVRRLIEQEVEIETTPGMIALAATALVNLGVLLYVARAARLTGSIALRADARHLFTNIIQAGGVILALALVATTGRVLFDGLVALLLGAYLLWTAAQVFMAALTEIMDVRLPEREEDLIANCLREHQDGGIRGYHDLRTRKAGRQRYVDFHLLVDPHETVETAHELCDRLERSIHDCLPGAVVTIHLEPDDGRYRGPMHEEHVEMGGESGNGGQ